MGGGMGGMVRFFFLSRSSEVEEEVSTKKNFETCSLSFFFLSRQSNSFVQMGGALGGMMLSSMMGGGGGGGVHHHHQSYGGERLEFFSIFFSGLVARQEKKTHFSPSLACSLFPLLPKKKQQQVGATAEAPP
jgi:hypothetical protein